MGKLFIIAAPSGAGKTSLVKELVEKNENLRVSISHTTRPQRPGEEHGVNYFFVSEEEFSELEHNHAFLESAHVYEYYYGTSKDWVKNKLTTETNIILEIDWQGAQQVRQLFPDCISIFILPPSRQALIDRLEQRGQDNKTVIENRMQKMRDEVSHANEFDFIIVNDDFDTAFNELNTIVNADEPKPATLKPEHTALLNELQNE